VRVAVPALRERRDVILPIARHYIGEALRLADGNETRAAQLLGNRYHTFRYRRKRLGI
jgi:DNA-binding NtrC family response regulator